VLEPVSPNRLTVSHIWEAHARIKDEIHGTPVITNWTLDTKASASLFSKCENLHKTRPFNARGASNPVFALSGAEFIHSSNDLRIMAGQGTIGLELLEDVPNRDPILCPVGGGGHLSGIAVATRSLNPRINVIGVEPAGADAAYRSLTAGNIIPSVNPKTVADGLLTPLADKTFAEIQQYVDRIVAVSKDAIVKVTRLLLGLTKVIVEPSGAVSCAALVERKPDVAGKRVGAILRGGNADLDRLPWAKRSDDGRPVVNCARSTTNENVT
jgi:threonine dehydratase